MKKYVYVVTKEFYDDYAGNDCTIIEVCSTFEKVINVMSALSGIRYNAARQLNKLRQYGSCLGKYIVIDETMRFRYEIQKCPIDKALV